MALLYPSNVDVDINEVLRFIHSESAGFLSRERADSLLSATKQERMNAKTLSHALP